MAVGLWAAFTNSKEAKQGVMLGTSVLFICFALTWFTRGETTGKRDFKKQGAKVLAFGLLFLFGFVLSLK